MESRQVIDAVYTMARLGLTEVAKDTRNGPAIVANSAAVLEQWRVAMERSFTEPQPTESKS